MEKQGLPTVLVSFDLPDLMKIADDSFMRGGVPACRQVGVSSDTTLGDLSAWVDDFIDALTKPLTAEEAEAGTYVPPKPPRIAMTGGTYKEVMDYFEGELVATPSGGPWAWMTVGLPIVMPTEEAVAEMLQGTSHSPDEEIMFGGGFSAAGPHVATVEKVAINAVMAGCKPEYLPVLLAIAESGGCVGYPGDSSFGHMYVVSGPIGKEIDMNSGFCYLESGNPANMALKHACQLMGVNLGACLHGINNLERTGSLHWGTIFAERPDTPWDTINVDLGYDADESILLFWMGKVQMVPFQQIEIMAAKSLQENQPGTPAHAVAALKASTNLCCGGRMLFFTPDTAKFWKSEYGFDSIQEFQDYFYDNVTWTAGEWYSDYWFWAHHRDVGIRQREPGTRMLNPDHLDLPDDAIVPMINSPEDITVIVAGGTGDAWTWGNSFGGPRVFSIDKWR